MSDLTLRRVLFYINMIATLCFLPSCSRKDHHQVQGYVEGEFVYVASPFGGRLESLHVERGVQVKTGDPLFTLESTSEKAMRDEAEKRLSQARSNLEDVKKGKRPTEIESIEAQFKQAQAALEFSEKEFERQKEVAKIPGATAVQDLDQALAMRDQNRQRVSQIEADLKTAQLGARTDQIEAAQANVQALESALVKAQWDLAQKSQAAPQKALVFDTLYREGEWVAAGRPVVALLPPQNIKVRAFVAETQIGTIHHGDQVQVIVDGVSQPFIGKVSFISPQAEYTPPVIYSQESRSKLVFMIEIVFDPQTSVNLHPGQPVDVQFNF